MKKKYGLFTKDVPVYDGLYDYSSPHAREETVCALVDNSALSRQNTEVYWRKMRRYYDGVHDIGYFSGSFSEDMNLPWTPAQATDGYIHIESQIDPNLPEFEFSPRASGGADAAKKREETVRRVCDINDLTVLNTRNERRLGIYGSAVWKIGWGNVGSGGSDERADVTVEAPLPEQIYADPTASEVDACEYIAFVYRMHRQRAYRLFERDMRERGEKFADYLEHTSGGITAGDGYSDEDTVTVTEFWFRQPTDGQSNGIRYAAGDIALCVLIGGKEVKYLPKYWLNTGFGSYPFVIYHKVPNEGSLWGKSELEPIIGLIDAADRDLTFAQLNAAFCSNDVILAEENAFSDGEAPDNSPGAVWKLRPGMMGKVQRLGNLSAAQTGLLSGYARFQNMMEQTTGNFDINQGKEPSRVTTATGIALLNERSASRQSLKKAGRTEGFRRLYRLIDMTAQEFYEKGRFVDTASLGFGFEPEEFRDAESGEILPLDIKIHIGDGLANSKAFTVSAISSLVGMNIDRDNYKLVEAYVEALGLPMRAEICAFIEEKFGNTQSDETPLLDALEAYGLAENTDKITEEQHEIEENE